MFFRTLIQLRGIPQTLKRDEAYGICLRVF